MLFIQNFNHELFSLHNLLMSVENQKALQKKQQIHNSSTCVNKAIDDHVDFDQIPKKLIYFYSKPAFNTVDERNEYLMGTMDMKKVRELRQKYIISAGEAKIFNDERREWIENQLQNREINENEELRKNLKILIIIGSKLEYTSNSPKPEPDRDKLILGYDEFNTALLICHLFHYACGILI